MAAVLRRWLLRGFGSLPHVAPLTMMQTQSQFAELWDSQTGRTRKRRAAPEAELAR